MKISFKNEKFLCKSESCTVLFSRGKKTDKTTLKIKNLPSIENGQSLLLYSVPELKNASAVLMNIDPKKMLSTEDMRELGGSYFKEFKKSKHKNIVLDFNSFVQICSTSAASLLKGFVEGLLLSDYSMNEGKTKSSKKTELNLSIFHKDASTSELKELRTFIKESTALADAVHFSRRLGDLPGNLMTPTLLGKNASSIKDPNLKVTVWNKAKIKKEKMNCLLSVSAGSSEEPKFIVMEYKGKKSSSKKPTLLVGKGLTFDAGGISLKPSPKMDEMRYDMCGGAAVIGAMKLITEMKLPVHVIALIPSSENLLGASATKPGDIYVAKNGKSVEVLNTDAEGRLILADALSHASTLKPKQVLCTATLTGAMVVALGSVHTGFFTRDDELAQKINTAAQKSGENLWRMPLTDEHSSDMKGRFADLSNISSSKGAGSATAAAFLENFCEKEIPFAHLDIAGTAWNAGNRKPYHISNGATGVLVRTFYEFVKANA